jgi:hypothetical protein
VTTPSAAPGWYPDPSGAPGQRYFDGTQWTDHRSDVPTRYRLSNEERADKLDAALTKELAYRRPRRVAYSELRGRRLRQGNPSRCTRYIRIFGVVTLLPCGLFVIPWIIIAVSNHERRASLEVPLRQRQYHSQRVVGP